ncbi:MAG: DoxX family membrane protein [Pseudomonadota bacterium]
MADNATYSSTTASIRGTLMTQLDAARAVGQVPGFTWTDRVAHWGLRVPLAALLLVYGFQKFPDAFVAPGDYGVPALLFILAAFAEILGPVALLAGGVVETWKPKNTTYRLIGDALTRGGAFAGLAAVMGVIFYFYWGALTWDDPHVVLLGLSAFLLLRGNRY